MDSWPGPICRDAARTTSPTLLPLAVHLGDAVLQGLPQSNCVRQVAFGLAVHAVVQKFAAQISVWRMCRGLLIT